MGDLQININITAIHKYKLKELLFIIIYWVIAVRIIVLLEFFGLNNNLVLFEQAKALTILRESLLAGTTAGFSVGLLTGLSELYIFQKYFQNKAFVKLLFTKLTVYLICIGVIAFFTLYSYYYFTKNRDFITAASNTLSMFSSNGFYHLLAIGALLSTGINFLLIMKNKVGHSIFIPIILGKYNRPKEENRIFLFIDLKSSTLVAEQLGHREYSLLIQDCFRDLSDLVIKYGGSIYQFVGDEVVITWKVKKERNYYNSIHLFFAYKKLLSTKADFYLEKYGTVPSFKAAVNSGEVMVAEVGGNIKSEIAYHGDVLNSAARMIELCNLYHSDLILSENFREKVNSDMKDIQFDFKGEFQLRGKNRKINIFSANELNDRKILI